jgi:plasmid replication initiation protein
MNNLTVYKKNALIEARYKLPLQAQKLVLACIAKLDSRAESGPIPKEITITAKEYGELMGVENNARRDLYSAADALFKCSVTLKDDEEETELYWVQKKVKKHRGDGAVTLTWSDEVTNYISMIEGNFTQYKLRNIAQLQSTHSIRIYELLSRFAHTGYRVISLEDFKAALGIEDKYPEFKILNRAVIKPAIEELNLKSDFIINYDTVKKGRTVTSLVFEFKRNNQLKMDL